MPSLNLDIHYFEHPKTKRLVGLLGRGSEAIPLKLWAHCGKLHADTGRLAGYSAQEIESIVGWWGKSGECVSALERLGWIDKVEDGWQVHDWIDHEGHLSAFHIRAKKGAAAKWAKYTADSATSNASSNACSNAPTQPNPPTVPTQPNPPNGVPPGKGVGEMRAGVGGGNGAGNMGLSFKREAIAQASIAMESELANLIRPLNLHPASFNKLLARNDVTPDRVRRELADIRRDGDVDNVGAVLCTRLGIGRKK